MIITPRGTRVRLMGDEDSDDVVLVMDVRDSLNVAEAPAEMHMLLSPDNVRELIIELEKHESF